MKLKVGPGRPIESPQTSKKTFKDVTMKNTQRDYINGKQ